MVDWVPRGGDLNPMETLWAEVVRTMEKGWQPAVDGDELWNAVEAAWLEVTASERYILALMASVPPRLAQVLEEEGGWTGY